MAIDWKVKFTLKASGHYSAVFQRYDDAEPDLILNTVNIGDAILDTDEQKKALWDLVYAQYQKQPVVDPAIAGLEDEGKTALVAKEK